MDYDLFVLVWSPGLLNAEFALPVNPGFRSPLLQNLETGSVRIGHRSRNPESSLSECGVRSPVYMYTRTRNDPLGHNTFTLHTVQKCTKPNKLRPAWLLPEM